MRQRVVIPKLKLAAYSEAGHAVANLIFSNGWPEDKFVRIDLSDDNPESAGMITADTDIAAWVHNQIENGYVLADLTDAQEDTQRRISARMVVTCADYAARKKLGDKVQPLHLFEYDEALWQRMVADQEFHWADPDKVYLLAFYLCAPANALQGRRPFTRSWNYRSFIKDTVSSEANLYPCMLRRMTGAVKEAEQLVEQHWAAIELLAHKLQENANGGQTETNAMQVRQILSDYFPWPDP